MIEKENLNLIKLTSSLYELYYELPKNTTIPVKNDVNPVIGLPFILELKDRKDKEEEEEKDIVICALCSLKLSPSHVREHVSSFKHGLAYAKKYMPYDLIRYYKEEDEEMFIKALINHGVSHGYGRIGVCYLENLKNVLNQLQHLNICQLYQLLKIGNLELLSESYGESQMQYLQQLHNTNQQTLTDEPMKCVLKLIVLSPKGIDFTPQQLLEELSKYANVKRNDISWSKEEILISVQSVPQSEDICFNLKNIQNTPVKIVWDENNVKLSDYDNMDFAACSVLFNAVQEYNLNNLLGQLSKMKFPVENYKYNKRTNTLVLNCPLYLDILAIISSRPYGIKPTPNIQRFEIMIQNVPLHVSKEQICQMFNRCGPLQDVKDNNNGTYSVCYYNEISLRTAIHTYNQYLFSDGTIIKIVIPNRLFASVEVDSIKEDEIHKVYSFFKKYTTVTSLSYNKEKNSAILCIEDLKRMEKYLKNSNFSIGNTIQIDSCLYDSVMDINHLKYVLKVTKLPKDYRSSDVFHFLKQESAVIEVLKLVGDRDAFAYFDVKEAAEEALRLYSGREFQGMTISVEFCQSSLNIKSSIMVRNVQELESTVVQLCSKDSNILKILLHQEFNPVLEILFSTTNGATIAIENLQKIIQENKILVEDTSCESVIQTNKEHPIHRPINYEDCDTVDNKHIWLTDEALIMLNETDKILSFDMKNIEMHPSYVKEKAKYKKIINMIDMDFDEKKFSAYFRKVILELHQKELCLRLPQKFLKEPESMEIVDMKKLIEMANTNIELKSSNLAAEDEKTSLIGHKKDTTFKSQGTLFDKIDNDLNKKNTDFSRKPNISVAEPNYKRKRGDSYSDDILHVNKSSRKRRKGYKTGIDQEDNPNLMPLASRESITIEKPTTSLLRPSYSSQNRDSKTSPNEAKMNNTTYKTRINKNPNQNPSSFIHEIQNTKKTPTKQKKRRGYKTGIEQGDNPNLLPISSRERKPRAPSTSLLRPSYM